MNKLNNLNIIKFSRISSSIMLFAITLAILSQTYFFIEVKHLVNKKLNMEIGYESLHEFKYQTEVFLTSYDLEENKKNLHNSYEKYLKGFELLNETVTIDYSLFNYHQIVQIKYDEIYNTIFNNEEFSEKNLMNKSILIRLGESNKEEENSEFFILLKSFYEKIEHFKQYQSFLLEDITEIKNKVYNDADVEIDRLNTLFIILPIIILIVAIMLSVIIDKAIKNKEQDLINTKSLIENILNSIPVRVFWKDTNGKYLGANKLFLQDAQLDSRNEIIGKTDFELPWAEFEAQDYVDDDNYVKNTKKPKLNIVETQTTQDGTLIHLNTSKVPLFDKNNQIIGILGLYEDITEKINTQEKIKAQEMQIIQQNRLAQMGEMIAMIAHQWRQPLTVISLLSGSLQLKSEKEEFDKDIYFNKLQKIVDQTNYLSHTIEDFRNFFKPDKEKSNITSKQLIEESLKIIEPVLKKHDIDIITSYLCEKELYIYPNEVKQVILNIIKNSQDAFIDNKTRHPYIKIAAQCQSNSKCTITIEDNAGGIPNDILNKIFDPYFSTKNDKNGTGLGLYMSKTIIEDHCKGELCAESIDNKTIFTITI